MKKQTEAHPQFANSEDSSADATAGGLPDGLVAGTPVQPKLKLTFNNAGANGATEVEDE